MASDQEPLRIGHQPPFSVPAERRDPARRLRGRLVAPVTVWTTGRPPGGAGLTVSSILVAEGEPARLLGLIDPTSAFWEAMRETGTFVVHVLAAGDRHLAERFAELRPPIRGPFERLEVAESPWGPVLAGRRPRAACRLAQSTPAGHGELVQGVIEQLELSDLEDPLAYLHRPLPLGGRPPGSRLTSVAPSPGRCIWPFAGWRWRPCRSCPPASA